MFRRKKEGNKLPSLLLPHVDRRLHLCRAQNKARNILPGDQMGKSNKVTKHLVLLIHLKT